MSQDLPREITEAHDLITSARIARLQVRSAQVIANSPLPARKQKFHDLLLSQCIVKERNSRSALDGHMRKLKQSQRAQVFDTYKGPAL